MRTIKSSSDVNRLFKKGRRISTPELSMIVLCTEGQHDQDGRVAFIAGKKLGNAVWRNRAKRRMREVCREVGGPFPGYDVAFVARKGAVENPYLKMADHVREVIKRNGLL